MKYESETGESMEKPSKKQKKVILIVGVTGAVYVSFQYLLPLVIPFLVAYGIALALRPSACWLEKKLQFQIRGKRIHLPLGLIGGVEIFILLLLVGIGIYFGGRKLCTEASLLIENMPLMIKKLDTWLTNTCYVLENVFHLKEGYLIITLRDMLESLVREAKSAAMPFLVVNTMSIFRAVIQVTVLTIILFVATVLSMQEMDSLRKRRDNSAFHREFTMLSNRLVVVGNAYLKTQASIILLTTVICTVGLMLMKNPYNILLGIGIGLLDALPIFGTGTVFIPWAIFCFASRQWGMGIGLVVIYLICYFLREIMEAKIMADKVGLTPLETLISMYVGLQLFGLLGFILGPIGLLIIEDMVDALCDMKL